jgi:nitrate reductase gamma subunit
MNVLIAVVSVAVLLVIALLGAGSGSAGFFFGVIVPYAAILIFVAGVVYRVAAWARSPVPFRIPTTCGQQKTLPWLKASGLEAPSSTLGVVGRMGLEVLFFRSLFRNTSAELIKGPRLLYGASKYLWLGALAFHWTLAVVLLRHLRFFLEPVPAFVVLVENLDGFFHIALPTLYVTDGIILMALGYLFLRRLFDAKLRYISLLSDYFALFLLLAIVISGIFMRYLDKTDLLSVKQLVLGLVHFRPEIPQGIGVVFYAHLFLVSVLLAYFPFSKLMHAGGIFLSPTRNLANDNRMRRHVNPWNYPVKVHTYEEWEDEFREKMRAAGLPLERE